MHIDEDTHQSPKVKNPGEQECTSIENVHLSVVVRNKPQNIKPQGQNTYRSPRFPFQIINNVK